MRLGDVKDLFGTMVRTVHLSTMVELTDSAWTSVASRDAEAKGLVKKAQRQKKSMDDLKISHRIFEVSNRMKQEKTTQTYNLSQNLKS